MMCRLRIRHINLNNTLFITGKHPTGYGEQCKEAATVQHVLSSCRSYVKERGEQYTRLRTEVSDLLGRRVMLQERKAIRQFFKNKLITYNNLKWTPRDEFSHKEIEMQLKSMPTAIKHRRRRRKRSRCFPRAFVCGPKHQARLHSTLQCIIVVCLVSSLHLINSFAFNLKTFFVSLRITCLFLHQQHSSISTGI